MLSLREALIHNSLSQYWETIHATPFLYGRNHQVAIEGDVDVNVIAVNGILTLALEEAHPDFIVKLKRKHDTLALHDGAVTGLCIQDHLLLFILHQVQIGLLEVPRVDVDVEEVNTRYITVELAFKHVEVFVTVDEDGVKKQCLVIVVAVEGLPAAHRERRVLCLAGVSWSPSLPFAAFKANGASGTWRTFCSCLTRSTSLTSIAFISCETGTNEWIKGWRHGNLKCVLVNE